MTFSEIFEAYYTLYRAEATTPVSTDDESIIAMRFANEAINRWANYDGTYWKELFTTLGESTQVLPALVTTVTTGTATYDCPTDMREAGGLVKIIDANGNSVRNYRILEPQEAQFRDDNAQYAYFTGNPTNGFVLHLNPAPDSAIDGLTIDYVYYKKPTLFTDGTSTTEVPDPYFIVNRSLAQRYRASRNPYYQSALRDSEDELKVMKMDNDSGSWANPWKLTDNSGSTWGI